MVVGRDGVDWLAVVKGGIRFSYERKVACTAK
jgi:hypothetical protein